MEREDTFHALCRCPRARALWKAMAEDWCIPDVDLWQNTGPEWLLHLLNKCEEHVRLPMLMTMWRCWHVRNEITHHKPAPPIEVSKRFLSSYIDTILCLQQHPKADMSKGKMVVSKFQQRQEKLRPARAASTRPPERWHKPPPGWTKLNVDGAYIQADGTGGSGMILRDEHGVVIFASCRFLRTCSSALEAEIEAIREGIALTLEWCTLPFILESDCSTAIDMIKSSYMNRSPAAMTVGVIKNLLVEGGREHVLMHVSRNQNNVSHVLG